MKFSLVALATFVGAAMANLDPIIIKVFAYANRKEMIHSKYVR